MKSHYSAIVGRIKTLERKITEIKKRWIDALDSDINTIFKLKTKYERYVNRFRFEEDQLNVYYSRMKKDIDHDFINEIMLISYYKIHSNGTFTVTDEPNYPDHNQSEKCICKCNNNCYGCGTCACECTCVANKYVLYFCSGQYFFQ